MDGQITGTNEAQSNETQVDPWIAAFAALEPKSEETSETAPDGTDGSNATPEQPGMQEVSDQAEAGNDNGDEAAVGGLDSSVGESGIERQNIFGNVEVNEESIEKYETDLNERVRDQAIKDIANEFIKRGIRNRNGVLGATLDDPDICKRDEDGVPRFYNPETGREFTGDNPRRQAQEWVDDYNKELARVFNNTCEQYEQHLKEEEAPGLAVMKFAPKYNKLDDIRRGMFDNIIEDYEIKDNDGNVVGYSCDLDKALALVDRQIAMIQNYAKQHQAQQPETQKPSGPALDMKTSSGAVQVGNDAPPSSLAEAMERLQDVQLSKIKNN